MSVLNNICINIEQFINVSPGVSEQHIELRVAEISRGDSDFENISEQFAFNYSFPNNYCIVSTVTRIISNDNVNFHKAYEIILDLFNSMVRYHDIKLKRSSKVTNVISITIGAKINGETINVTTITLLFQQVVHLKKKTMINFYLLFNSSLHH